jgi:hypothetical protein
LVAKLKAALGIARGQASGVGLNPNLQQVAGALSLIPLATHDAASGTHPLHLPGPEQGAMAHGIAVGELTLKHHRDDLHIAVAVHAKSATRLHLVIVDHQQWPKTLVEMVKMIAKIKCVPAIQPIELGMKSLTSGPEEHFCGNHALKLW